jgi:hypothetical protein
MHGVSVLMSMGAFKRVKLVGLSRVEWRETDLATKNESSMLRIACKDFDDGLSDSSCSSCNCDIHHYGVEALSI